MPVQTRSMTSKQGVSQKKTSALKAQKNEPVSKRKCTKCDGKGYNWLEGIRISARPGLIAVGRGIEKCSCAH